MYFTPLLKTLPFEFHICLFVFTVAILSFSYFRIFIKFYIWILTTFAVSFFRMPDQDFSVNDVKLFVGKCFCGGNAEFGYMLNYILTRISGAALVCFSLSSLLIFVNRKSADDWRDGCVYSEGHGDVNGPVEALLWDSSLSEREALQCYQPWI